MKSLVKAVAIAAVLATPLAAFAQSNQPVTRAQVRQELIQLEQAGYNPATANDYDYPANIQAAEARVTAQKDGTAQAAATGYGPAVGASSKSGSPVAAPGTQPIYFGNGQ
ncbi:DUF4148 domain-containing protein [Trinickia terrae]|uniref:DUF4148 domain-containing protein n=1 Tax=Trinickia terrae TaxID=2571161 RepID=A0A4U1I0Q9_9BURK|nr:DUF4148 domain-containing protein [Trinickia terrae]TKC86688.1 DUF4148 domain-containing protein [Trinickia terrae]